MSDEMREAFEKWYAQKYLGVNVGDAFEYLPSHGYKRLDVHFPWLGYQAATAAADAKYLPVIEKLVEAADKMEDFIMTWRDCLEGVQMTEDDFKDYCGVPEYRKALTPFTEAK